MNNAPESNSQALAWVTVPGTSADQPFTKLRYDQFVEKLFKKEDRKLMLYHAIAGLTTEAGEAADPIKAHCAYGRDIDRENVVEELGDLRFYMQAIMNMIGISEMEILNHNARKLAKRYNGLMFTEKQANERADKVQGLEAQ